MRGIPGREREELWICPKAAECGCNCIFPKHSKPHKYREGGCDHNCAWTIADSICIRYIPEKEEHCPFSDAECKDYRWKIAHGFCKDCHQASVFRDAHPCKIEGPVEPAEKRYVVESIAETFTDLKAAINEAKEQATFCGRDFHVYEISKKVGTAKSINAEWHEEQ